MFPSHDIQGKKAKAVKVDYKPPALQQLKTPSGLAVSAQQTIAKQIAKEEKPLQEQVPTLKEAQRIPKPAGEYMTQSDLTGTNQKPVKRGKKLVKMPADVFPEIQTETEKKSPNIVMESLDEEDFPYLRFGLSDLSDIESIEGKGIKISDVKKLLTQSYQNKRQDVGDWKLDSGLSKPEAQVYHKDGKAVVVHRGTKRLADWGTNLAMSFGITTDRMKRARDIQRKAESKYGKENITTLGHSLGAKLSEDYGKGKSLS